MKCGSKLPSMVRGRGRFDLAFEDDARGFLAHDEDAVRQVHRLAQVVGDQDGAEPMLQPERLHDAPQLLARERVEGCERLVQHHELRLMHQGATETGALLHAARELPGKLGAERTEPDGVEHGLRARLVLGPLAPALALERLNDLERKQHVAQCRAPRHQRRILERHADAFDRPVDDVVVDDHLARTREQKPCHQLHQCRFAAARRSDDGDELALTDAHADAIKRQHALVGAIRQTDVFQADERPGICGPFLHNGLLCRNQSEVHLDLIHSARRFTLSPSDTLRTRAKTSSEQTTRIAATTGGRNLPVAARIPSLLARARVAAR